jgi:hypothetical protein
MLYGPGMFSQMFIVIIFLAVSSFIGYLGIRIYIQEGTIHKQELKLKDCDLRSLQLQENNDFLKENVKIIKDYEQKVRKKKPVVITPEGKLNVENLFRGSPR